MLTVGILSGNVVLNVLISSPSVSDSKVAKTLSSLSGLVVGWGFAVCGDLLTHHQKQGAVRGAVGQP